MISSPKNAVTPSAELSSHTPYIIWEKEASAKEKGVQTYSEEINDSSGRCAFARMCSAGMLCQFHVEGLDEVLSTEEDPFWQEAISDMATICGRLLIFLVRGGPRRAIGNLSVQI